MNKKEDLESLNEAARSNLEFSFYGMIGKLVKDPKRRGKKKQSDVPCESIVLAQADTANIVLRSLCSAIECASPKTLDRVVSVVTHLLPRLLQRRDFDRFVGELLFKSVAYVVCFSLTQQHFLTFILEHTGIVSFGVHPTVIRFSGNSCRFFEIFTLRWF